MKRRIAFIILNCAATAVMLGEGVNASQMWRFGSPYCWPLTFVALAIVGILCLPKKSEAKS